MNMKRNRMRPHGGGGGRGFNPPRFQGQGGGRQFHNNSVGNNPENDRRIRANALKMIEKYQNMAKDALMNGDVVMAENYHQHADHFQRVLNAHAPRFPEQNEIPEQQQSHQPQPSFPQDPSPAPDEPPHQPGRFPPDDFYPEPSPRHAHTPTPRQAPAPRAPQPTEAVEALRDVPFLSGASLAPRIAAPEEEVLVSTTPSEVSSSEGGIVRRRRTRIPRRPTENNTTPED